MCKALNSWTEEINILRTLESLLAKRKKNIGGILEGFSEKVHVSYN